jgi:hypothetical protein
MKIVKLASQDETLKVSSDNYYFHPCRSSPSLSAMRNLSDTKKLPSIPAYRLGSWNYFLTSLTLMAFSCGNE